MLSIQVHLPRHLVHYFNYLRTSCQRQKRFATPLDSMSQKEKDRDVPSVIVTEYSQGWNVGVRILGFL